MHTAKRTFQVTNSQSFTVPVLMGLLLGRLGAIPVAAGSPQRPGAAVIWA